MKRVFTGLATLLISLKIYGASMVHTIVEYKCLTTALVEVKKLPPFGDDPLMEIEIEDVDTDPDGIKSVNSTPGRLKIIVVVDRSSSIQNQSNYANFEGIESLCKLINQYSGMLGLTSFGDISKKYLVSYRSIDDNIERPIKKLKGESNIEYKQRIERWRKSRKGKTGEDVQAFLDNHEVQLMLDYSVLDGSSEVTGGTDMAIRFSNELDPDLGRGTRKIIILVTDGQGNSKTPYALPTHFDGEIYCVHRSSSIGVLQDLVPANNVYHSFDAVVRQIISSHQNRYR